MPSSLVPLQTTTLRATFSVNQAGQGYLGAFSTPMVLPARWVSLTLAQPEISFGDAVKLTGRVSTRQAGTALTILSRAAAKPEFQQLATLTSGAGGKWTFMTHPKVGTAYQAQYSGASSRVLGVGVHPDVAARIISSGRVWTHVGAGRSLAGRAVQVQQLVEGQWHTIAKARLNRNSEATFPAAKLPGGASTLRIAMSVNQAGTGLPRRLQPHVRLPAVAPGSHTRAGGASSPPARPLEPQSSVRPGRRPGGGVEPPGRAPDVSRTSYSSRLVLILVVDLGADLAGRERRVVHVRVRHARAYGGDELVPVAGGNALGRRARRCPPESTCPRCPRRPSFLPGMPV